MNAWRVPLVTYGKGHHQAEALIGDAVASVVGYARGAGKPLVIERLDFRQKKAVLEGESRRYSRMLSSRYLISRTTKAPNRRKRRQMRSAQARMRQRITNLVDELHWQLVRWLTSNYQIILLPTFETHDLTQRAGRKIRSKTARMMLTFRNYEFKQRLKWKAWQRGALVLDVDEAYTSKTRSWDGTVNTKLGGAKAIRDDTGFGMDRDVNGARGIFLRALGDSPFLRGLLTQVASQTTAASSNVV